MVFLFLGLILSCNSYSKISDKNRIKYQTYFGDCPSRTAGSLAFRIVKSFENSRSLKKVKDEIIKEDLASKYYLSDYLVSYDPFSDQIRLSFNCSRPLMRVQVTTDGSRPGYSAILTENGSLLDPTYEMLLRDENKLIDTLSILAIPIKEIDGDLPKKMASLFSNLPKEFKIILSEVIVNNDNKMTVILSLNKPVTAFLGKNEWNTKISKLEKIVNFLGPKGKMPSIVNLSNHKKVVVKFSDKF